MKRFLGLDISSSNTGWNVVDLDDNDNNKKLIEYGLISPTGGMGVTQRLYFFGNELKKIIEKFQPNEIVVEETILVRGPKIMRTLARFSGVALFLAYSYQKREIPAFEPTYWKKKIGLKGFAKKPEIQVKICEAFQLIDKQKIDLYLTELKKNEISENEIKQTFFKEYKQIEKDFFSLDKQTNILKKDFKKKKKKEITENDLKQIENFEKQLQQKKDELKLKKKQLSDAEKEIGKRYDKISIDIYSDSGINSDIADSIGVTLCALNENEKQKF